LGAQVLVVGLIILIGSELFFVSSTLNTILVAITLLLSLVFGYLLIQSVKREVEAREKIQILAKDLQSANDHQTALIHFITHQVKGFFTKSRNIFDGLRSGDYGVMPEEATPMIAEGFASDTKAVGTVQDILKAANIQKGTMAFKKEPFNFKQIVEDQVEKYKSVAQEKGIKLELAVSGKDFNVTGDKEQVEHAVRNLIDNSIKYTPRGAVSVSLNHTGDKIRFSVKDTGIGITAEDKKRLFTEGGRGENSVKTNIESTGYGLYIVKGIIEAHGGTVSANSEGEGKGSEFIVELPVG